MLSENSPQVTSHHTHCLQGDKVTGTLYFQTSVLAETFQRERGCGCKEKPVVLHIPPPMSLFIQSSKHRYYENMTVM